ncbi:MAG: YafY family transcriptional regulator [Gammaproteobacteria bacterium]|nr:YafY family transcriptional regulator [Gammaproteobacteria bacterium]
MSRSTRMFEVIQILRSANQSLTAQNIADELEVNKRTVYRDIAALQAMRVPIEGEAGIGYIMRRGYDLPPLMFNSEEIEALMLGLSLLGRTGDKALEKTADAVSRKIAEAVPQDLQPAVLDSPILASSWHTIPDSDVNPQLVRNCIRNEQPLEFDYTDDKGVKTHRTVMPIALLYYIEVVLVAAWCDLRKDFRHFRLDRMQNCTVAESEIEESVAQLRRRWRSKHDLTIFTS